MTDAFVVVWRYAYRVAAWLHLPTGHLYRAYVRAVRRSNDMYWDQWAREDFTS